MTIYIDTQMAQSRYSAADAALIMFAGLNLNHKRVMKIHDNASVFTAELYAIVTA